MKVALGLVEKLKSLANAHERDGDGGYAHAFAIRDLYRDLDREQQGELLKALVSTVLAHDRSWGVALEALIQIGSLENGDELLGAVQSGLHDWEWRDDVIFALLSLRYAAQPVFYNEYVSRALKESRPHAVPLAAGLARVHPDASTDVLSEWLASARAAGRSEGVEGYAATIVRNYLAVDEQLLPSLVRKMREQDPGVARWFARCLNAYLTKPWMLKELGDHRNAAMRAQIAAAAEGRDCLGS
jgi:hypothetical protein